MKISDRDGSPFGLVKRMLDYATPSKREARVAFTIGTSVVVIFAVIVIGFSIERLL